MLFLEGKGDIDFNRDDWDGDEAEREMRRVFGKCIAGSGEPAIDRSSGVRRALRSLVCAAGADLLQEAVNREPSLAADIAELNCRVLLERWTFRA